MRVFVCDNCNTITYEKRDRSRFENFCSTCGVVTSHTYLPLSGEGFVDESTSVGLSDEEIDIYIKSLVSRNVTRKKINRVEWLQQRYSNPTYSKKDWRYYNYFCWIGIVSTHFEMTPGQKEDVWYYIRKIDDLNKIYTRAGYEQVITSLCIHMMRRDGRKLRFNSRSMSKNQRLFLLEIGLNEDLYLKIIEGFATVS